LIGKVRFHFGGYMKHYNEIDLTKMSQDDFDFLLLETQEKLSASHAQALKEQRIRQLESINNL